MQFDERGQLRQLVEALDAVPLEVEGRERAESYQRSQMRAAHVVVRKVQLLQSRKAREWRQLAQFVVLEA